jgi:hypothetical protein
MMNDELNNNEEQLRLATSRVLPAEAKLDVETASLREGFLAIGSAVEAAAGDFDETAFVERLRSNRRNHPETRVKEVAKTKAPYRFIDVMVGVVLAASVLIAVGRLVVVSPQADKPGQVVVAPLAPAELDSSPDDSALPEAAPSAAVAKAWIDPLDEEIALAQAEMQWLTSRGYGLDGSLSQVGWQLEALSQELGGGSL